MPPPSAQLVKRVELWAAGVREVKPNRELDLSPVVEERAPEDPDVEAALERAHSWAIRAKSAAPVSGYPWLRTEE